MAFRSKELFDNSLRMNGIDYTKAAEMMGRNSKQSLFVTVNRGSLHVDEFIEFLGKFGMSLHISMPNGMVVRERSKRTPSIRRSINGTVYDSSTSYVLASTAFKNPDGTEYYNGEVTEMLMTKDGNIFFATWREEKNNSFRIMDENYQQTFLREYSTVNLW